MPTASVYVRISLDPSGNELGIERQEQECRELCTRQGWEVGEVYADNDLSATSGVVRPAFERLLRSKPELVVCWHSDRFIRLTRELERVIELEINVHAVHVGNLDLSSHSGRMVARIVTAVAQHEGEQKSARQRAAHRQRAAQGRHFWGADPFAYIEGGKVHPVEGEALRKAYADLLAGTPVTALARRFNSAGLLTRNAKRWTPATFRRLLLSPRNAAINTHHGEEVGPGTWEPVIPVETYRATEALLASPGRGRTWNKGGRRPTALLSGLARCQKCGDTVRAWRRGAEVEAVYVCRVNGCCTAPLERADGMVLQRLVEALNEDDVRRYWAQPAEVGDRTALLGRTHLLREKLTESAAAYAAGSLTMTQLTTITETLRADLDGAEAELAALVQPHLAADLLRDAEAVWVRLAAMELEELRTLVSEVFTTITVVPRGRGGGRRPFTREHLLTEVRGALPSEAPPAL